MKNLIKILFLSLICINQIFSAAIGSGSQELNSKFMKAVRIANIDAAEKFLNDGAGINSTNGEGNTGLLQIADNKKAQFYQMAKFLIDNRANINKANDKGLTPLMVAVLVNNEKLIRLLLDNSADVNLVDKAGLTALGRALINSTPEIIDLLIKSGAQATEEDLRQALVSALVSPEKDKNKTTRIAKILSLGAKVNIADEDGVTPLMEAAKRNSTDVVKLLLEKNVDVTAKDKLNQSALDYAINEKAKNDEIIRILKNKMPSTAGPMQAYPGQLEISEEHFKPESEGEKEEEFVEIEDLEAAKKTAQESEIDLEALKKAFSEGVTYLVDWYNQYKAKGA